MPKKYIDTHIHLWDLANDINLWIKKDSNLYSNYLNSDYIQSGFNPDGIVVIEAASSQFSILELAWLESLFTNVVYPVKYISYIDMLQNKIDFQAKLDLFKPYKALCGFRQLLAYKIGDFYSPCAFNIIENQELLDNLIANCIFLQEYGYILELQLYPKQFIQLKDKLFNLPIKIVLEHTLLPTMDDYNIWLEAITIINQSKNIYLKISGFDINSNQMNYMQILNDVINRVDHDRLLIGSNYPFIKYNEFSYIINSFDGNLLVNIYANTKSVYNFK